MKTNPESETKEVRKPYLKPQVKRVLLKPEEAVLGSCKTAASHGPAQSNCRTPGKCKVIGS